MSPEAPNLPLRERKIDVFFAAVFSVFTGTSLISDLLPTIGVDFSRPTGNFFVDSNYWYAHDADPLFMHPPDWMRIVTGLSAFVYLPFYVVLVWCLLTGRNGVQLFAVVYATMISTLTGIVVFGVEFFGDPATRTGNPGKFLAFNLPYVVIPLLLLVRMRKPLPFTRRF
ncbi:EXPERA domain-containing protein [Amycolatopsis benzoatilytica]|uniref:EXPERA domain-containing protein n=1 Tax=Amycolatopsis benzoatilytica TaxID=346045 RepID=UPI0003700600|nr:emopamil-binding family protein [Amycolatopsis benzoatilytica]